jgi:hypothetical protein
MPSELKVSGDGTAEICGLREDERRAGPRFAGFAASRHFHHDRERALMPSSAANSAAVSPLSRQRSTRFAHSSCDVRSISASGAETYATGG